VQKLSPSDLMSLEQYSRERQQIRKRMIEYRGRRRLQVGPHCTWSFEDRETVRYQLQEMLRAEKVFEAAGIEEELATYNPLIPDGRNLKATLLIEYPDREERTERLKAMRGIERRCWLRVDGQPQVFAIADEDLERETDEKTSAVHFLRFEFTATMIESLRGGAGLAAGIDHPAYPHSIDPMPAELRQSLLADLR
jgi:hypothetical protein